MNQVPWGLDESHTTSLRDRRERLVGGGCRQPDGAPAALSGALRAHVKDERFGIVTSIRGLPLGVRDGAADVVRQSVTRHRRARSQFQVAEASVNPKLPPRRLIAAGCSYKSLPRLLRARWRAHTWHVALFHWTPEATRFEWGGAAPGGLKTIADVRRAVLSGAIQRPPGFW